MMRNSVVIFFLALQIGAVQGQNVTFKKSNFPGKKAEFKKALHDKRDGDHYFAMGITSYDLALENYQRAHAFNPNNAYVNYQIGLCLLSTPKSKTAFSYFDKAYELDSLIAEDFHYNLGRAHHQHHDWAVAIRHYQIHKDLLKWRKDNKMLVIDYEYQNNEMIQRIRECNFGIKYTNEPHDVRIENVGDAINTPYPETQVVLAADESVMMFTSGRPGSTGEEPLEDGLTYHFHLEDIFISEHKANGQWSEAKGVGVPLNSARNDASLSLSADGHKLIIYRSEVSGGNLYESHLKDGNWTEPVKLNNNINSLADEKAASITPDGKSLYFVSNREMNNIGGYDIYRSDWDEDTQDWGKAINLGPTINTEYNEMGVFIHADGEHLYFSSEGHSSMGGFDFFVSKKEKEGQWSAPRNLGYPLNSAGNEVGIVVTASGQHGFISSDRPEGKGQEDIYMVTFPTEDIDEHMTLITGHLLDSETHLPIHGEIEVIDLHADEKIVVVETDSISGHFLLALAPGKEYGLEIDARNHLFHSMHFNVSKTGEYHEYHKEIELLPIRVGLKEDLHNLYFEENGTLQMPESHGEMEELLKFCKKNETTKIEIITELNTMGATEENKITAQKRAVAIVTYLIDGGIPAERLVASGIGDQKLQKTKKEVANKVSFRVLEVR